ncbi:Hypothetical predicted protein [Mytilus galloprovincialis]|uniref:DDE-1 domain-containing protein n=1 Tax=Mytilus galloprovincialis TaxID=29158 RepID=A0A8B6C5G9_MYTGA|nr:Hypothetical predicted protein [Mytilus galloprovincialis]
MPKDWLYATAENGYITRDLFEKWFANLLIIDNHSSHLSIPVIDMAIEHIVEVLGLPPHTSYFLQPFDQIFHPFRSGYKIRHNVDPHIIAVTAEVHADIKTTEESESLEQIKLCRPRVRKANKKFRKIESAEDDEDDVWGLCDSRQKKQQMSRMALYVWDVTGMSVHLAGITMNVFR